MVEPWQRLTFEEQIAFLAERVNVPTDSYRDVSGAEHDAAFVVAGAKGAVLNDFRGAVDRAIATGQTLEQFRQEFDSIVERTGWTFRGGSAWRANVIWDTNLRTSYAAGRYEQMQQVTTSRPYWQWRHGGSAHPRPQHLALDGKVFRHDDPFWSSFGSPPSGYGCRCSLFTLSDRDLERRGLAAEPGPQLGDRLPIPDLPGQTTAMNPPAGWGHLHGSSGPQHRAQLLDAVTRRLDPAIAAQVRAEAAARQPKVAPSQATGFSVGEVTREIIDDEDVYEASYTFSIDGGNLDGTETVVQVTISGDVVKKRRELDINFTVNDRYNTTNTRPEIGTLISNKIGELFRTNLQEQPDGTRFFTLAFAGDSRSGFREAMYAKVGFSFPAGEATPGEFGQQHGVVKDGRLVPANSNYRPFGKAKQEEHRQAVRQSIRVAIRDARGT